MQRETNENRSKKKLNKFSELQECREGILLLDISGNLCFSNLRAKELLCFSADLTTKADLLHLFEKIVDSDMKPLSIGDILFGNAPQSERNIRDMPIGLYRKDLSLIWLLTTVEHRTVDRIEYTCVSLIDVTTIFEKKRMLFQQGLHLNLVVSSIDDIIFEIGSDGTFLNYWANDPNNLFVPPEEFMHKKIRDVLPSRFAELMLSMVESTINKQTVQQIKYQSPFETDDSDTWYRMKVRPIRGKTDRVTVVISDITEEIQNWRQATVNEEKFNKAFFNSTMGMALVDLEGRFIEMNKTLCDMLDYKAEAFIGLRFIDITHPDDIDACMERFYLLRGGEIEDFILEKRYLRHDGTIIWCLLTVSFIHDQTGKPLFYLAQIQDISLFKQNDAKLLEKTLQLEQVKLDLESRLSQLGNFNQIVVHNLRGPISNIDMLLQAIKHESDLNQKCNYLRLLDDCNTEVFSILQHLVAILENNNASNSNLLK